MRRTEDEGAYDLGFQDGFKAGYLQARSDAEGIEADVYGPSRFDGVVDINSMLDMDDVQHGDTSDEQ